MSAANANARVHEPTMDEILASIRRIIADDQGDAPARAAEPDASGESPAAQLSMPAAGDEDDVLDLDDEVAALPEAPPAPAPAPPVPEPASIQPAPAPPRPVERPAPVRQVQAEAPEPFLAAPPSVPGLGRIVSARTDAAVGGAFNALASTILSQNARTLEDLVEDMLRPMLKEWLDDNLPTIVERLVRAEIERVARGGR